MTNATNATDATVLRAKSPEDLLALVPSVIGFHPVDSFVWLTLGEATHPFHARMDLPEDPVGIEQSVGYLADVAEQHGVRQGAVVVYSTDAGAAEALVATLDGRLRRGGARVQIECCLRADGERYWVLGADDADDVDGDGTAYDIGAHPFLARAVYEGKVVHGDRAELAASLAPTDPHELADIARIADGVAVRLARALCLTGPSSTGPSRRLRRRRELELEARWVRHRVRRALEGGERLDRHDAARLCVLISASVDVRDVAWAEMSHANAGAHEDLWSDLVRRVPPDIRAAPAALLGFSAWLAGHGALAWCAVDVAQRADPDYSLAKLISDMLVQAVPPSTWTPLPKGILRLP